MATLLEYFEKDGGRTFCLNRTIQIPSTEGEIQLEVTGRLHIDLESNAWGFGDVVENVHFEGEGQARGGVLRVRAKIA